MATMPKISRTTRSKEPYYSFKERHPGSFCTKQWGLFAWCNSDRIHLQELAVIVRIMPQDCSQRVIRSCMSRRVSQSKQMTANAHQTDLISTAAGGFPTP